ncbi:histidine phosphatase family protein [Alkalihalobacterium chitinilyticum]|uniref:Histidine phosphatase family protein n=1 Tax=Alkalihalobacterium chitinilyticum TaxID=2980103 RepID=A0ABT5VH10_9BACI|nr:histidine phosphatase family protein [Alkalihalobacterium chitinilyticum]MDE5414743.1 histidine phosphatase family protein [Alkalihalobacterium chitinilyticum]
MFLYFIRHGESEGNKLGIIQGTKDFSLSELGQRQAELVARYFEKQQLDYIYSSDLTRAYETATAIAQRKELTAHKWEKLREINLGPLEGKTRQEIYSQFPEVKEHSILTSGVEGTETIEEITARCQYLLEQMKRAHEGKHVALVAHGGLISIALMYILLGEQWHVHHRPFQIENTSITLVEFKSDRKPLIHYINRTTHLEFETIQQDHSLLDKEA